MPFPSCCKLPVPLWGNPTRSLLRSGSRLVCLQASRTCPSEPWLIERVHDRIDYRLVRLHLTGEGQELIHALATAAIAFNQRLLQGFSHEERELLLQQFARIRGNALSIREESPHLDISS